MSTDDSPYVVRFRVVQRIEDSKWRLISASFPDSLQRWRD